MTVIIWRTNESRTWAAICLQDAQARFPDAHVVERNARWFRAEEAESADAVYVHPQYPAISEFYRHAGSPVITSITQQGEPEIIKIGALESMPIPDEPLPMQQEAARMVGGTVAKLQGMLSRRHDADLIEEALLQEAAGQNRPSALKLLNAHLKSIRRR